MVKMHPYVATFSVPSASYVHVLMKDDDAPDIRVCNRVSQHDLDDINSDPFFWCMHVVIRWRFSTNSIEFAPEFIQSISMRAMLADTHIQQALLSS
jgi:hypothetical protein